MRKEESSQGTPDADEDAIAAFLASLASDHDDLGPRLRSINDLPPSGRPGLSVHAHYLSFRSGRVTMEDFVEVLVTKLIGFCLPRREIASAARQWEQLVPSKMMEGVVRLQNRAVDLFKKANRDTNRNGEFGEVIAYLLIESVLRAPQLVAKMGLKTSSQMPVHGSDGIHFSLDQPGNRLRLYWGESKCHASIAKAINEAATSVADNLKHDKMSHELFLIERHADLDQYPAPLREAILDFLDPYSESSNSRIDTSVMLIAFDYEEFGRMQGVNPDQAEVHFANRLTAELPGLSERVNAALEAKAVPRHDLHVFFLPVPSIAAMRERFQARIGWSA